MNGCKWWEVVDPLGSIASWNFAKQRVSLTRMSDAHSRIIAAAAKKELAPLGFRQQGRSRLWFADRGSWLNVVEFTPSRWSKSVALTNAAHWLWVGHGFMSFDEVAPSQMFAEFESEHQFSEVVGKIAEQAMITARTMDERFPSFDAIAEFVVKRALGSPDRMGTSWWGYEAAIACGLLGQSDEASRFLRGITDGRVVQKAALLMPIIGRPDLLRSEINNMVAAERDWLKLNDLDQPAFR